MSTETERTTPLQTITRPTTAACRNTFDTTALALTDMEQANIAYGRNYIRLEVPEDAYLAQVPSESERRGGAVPTAPPAARLGAETASARLERSRSAGLSRLLVTDGFVPRDEHDRPRPVARMREGAEGPVVTEPADSPGRPRVPVIKATTLGLRAVVGWVAIPPEGVVVEAPPVVAPGLYLVQRFRLATFARGFGLGDHLYSFTLFPEEEVEIEIKTWKSREQVDKTGSSIFDGQSETAEASFEDAVQQENARTSKRDSSFEAHVEASGESSWGFGSASIQAGARTSTAESTEQFAKNVSSATQKVANKANRERRVEVTQSSEVKTTEGEETRTKRKLRNINKCNTLNFNYFQLVRKYETRLELYDVKVRYSSGVPFFDEVDGVWRYESEEVALSELNAMLGRVLQPSAAAAVKEAVFAMLGAGSVDDEGLNILTPTSEPNRMRLDVVALATMVEWEEAARDAANRGQPIPPKPRARLPLLMSRDERVIATNAVYADAMLGKCPACDDFIQDSRMLEVESQQLQNRSRELAVQRARAELSQYQNDPVKRRVIQLEGLPEGATVHVHLDERDTADHVHVGNPEA